MAVRGKRMANAEPSGITLLVRASHYAKVTLPRVGGIALAARVRESARPGLMDCALLRLPDAGSKKTTPR